MDRTLVICNPGAGGGNGAECLAERLHERNGIVLQETEGPGDARRIAREAAGFDRVVAAGGDGTVHEVAAGLLERPTPPVLAIVPLGTGNDLARSLGIPTDQEEALALLDEGKETPLDVVELDIDGEEALSVNAVVAGAGGQVGELMDEDLKRRWGPLSYLRSAVETLGELVPVEVELEVDGESRTLTVLNVVVANGRFAGHGMPIAPAADPGDGELDVAVILEGPATRLLGLAPALLAGEEPEDELFFSCRGREVRLRAREPIPLSIDGENRSASSAHFRVRPGALRVIVP